MSIATLKRKLENPFAVIAQAFVLGVILFWAISAHESRAHHPEPAPPAVQLQN